jgi:uncharacterized protein DUF3800
LSFFGEFAQFVRLRRYRESVYAVIGAYMDESFDTSKKGIFAVGGILGRGAPILDLEICWEQLRRRDDVGIKYFKATECEWGKGEFAHLVADSGHPTPTERQNLESISSEFVKMIGRDMHGESHLALTGVGIVQEDFHDLIQNDYNQSILGDSVFRLAYDLAFIQCAWSMKEHFRRTGEHERVSFVCDETEEHSSSAGPAYTKLKNTNPEAEKYMATFSFADDKDCQPLQAADAVAFEIRRAIRFKLGKSELRKQFGLLDDSLFLIQYADKKNLQHIIDIHKPGQPLSLDAIMDQQFSQDIWL